MNYLCAYVGLVPSSPAETFKASRWGSRSAQITAQFAGPVRYKSVRPQLCILGVPVITLHRSFSTLGMSGKPAALADLGIWWVARRGVKKAPGLGAWKESKRSLSVSF